MPHVQRRLVGLLLIAALLLAACGGETATPEATPEPHALLEQAAAEIQEVDSFGVTIQADGAPALFEVIGAGVDSIQFVRAVGHFVAPNAVQAEVRVILAGITGQVDVVAVGDEQYFRHPVLTLGQWLNAQFSPGFNAETFVRSDEGLPRALDAVGDLVLVGEEDLNGVPVWHITGTALGSEVAALTFGLIAGEADVLVDVFIRTDDGLPEALTLLLPDTATEAQPEPTRWTIELYDYNDPFAVDAPQNAVTPVPTATPAEPTTLPSLPES